MDMEPRLFKEGTPFADKDEVYLQLGNENLIPEWLVQARRAAQEAAEPVHRAPELTEVQLKTQEIANISMSLPVKRRNKVERANLPFAA